MKSQQTNSIESSEIGSKNKLTLYQRNLQFLLHHATKDTLLYMSEMERHDQPGAYDYKFFGKTIEACSFNKPDGKSLRLHSSRDPFGEAKKQVESWYETLPDHYYPRQIVVFGIAGLFHVKELCNNPSLKTIIIVDNDIESFTYLFDHVDLSRFQPEDGQITFCVHPNLETLRRELKIYIHSMLSLDLQFFSHPAVARVKPELAELTAQLHRDLRVEVMDRCTTAAFADEWQQNTILNLPEISQNPTIASLKDLYHGEDAFVIAAGPSLKESLETIKSLEEKVFIICVGTALKPCLAAGIEPDVVIVIDSAPKVYKQFLDVKPHKSYLVGSQTLFSPIIKDYKEKYFSYECHIFQDFAKWMSQFYEEESILITGGTVSLSAVDLAHHIGCKRIFIFGLDLAFLEDGTSHAPNSMYDGNDEKHEMIRVPGNYSETVPTIRQFATYIDIMNNYLKTLAANNDLEVYNVTSGGAALDYTELVHPRELHFFDFNFSSSFQRLVDVHKAYVPNLSRSRKAIEDTIDNLTSFHAFVEEHRHDSELRELIDTELSNNAVLKQILGPALHTLCMHVLAQESEDINEKLEDTFYKHLSGAADWLKGLLEKTLSRFADIAEHKRG